MQSVPALPFEADCGPDSYEREPPESSVRLVLLGFLAHYKVKVAVQRFTL
jgi:hypothetical protein